MLDGRVCSLMYMSLMYLSLMYVLSCLHLSRCIDQYMYM